MPAGLPGSTPVQNAANPSAGTPVIFDLLSGPKGSPRDNDKDYPNGGNWQTGTGVANNTASTGALSTGIGFGPNVGPQGTKEVQVPNGSTQNFTDDYVPGISRPDKTVVDSTIMYIGGGKTNAVVNGAAQNVPYTAGYGIGAAGSGGSRDAGAGPAFTGFTMKTVTAAADIPVGSPIEAGFVNRSTVPVMNGNHEFGSTTTATVAPSMTKEEKEAVEHDKQVAEQHEKTTRETLERDRQHAERVKADQKKHPVEFTTDESKKAAEAKAPEGEFPVAAKQVENEPHKKPVEGVFRDEEIRQNVEKKMMRPDEAKPSAKENEAKAKSEDERLKEIERKKASEQKLDNLTPEERAKKEREEGATPKDEKNLLVKDLQATAKKEEDRIRKEEEDRKQEQNKPNKADLNVREGADAVKPTAPAPAKQNKPPEPKDK